jgi:predicted nucleic acid-binding protein
MRTLKIYLDTSVISFYDADDAPEKRDITRSFFDDFVKPGIYEVFISNIVLAEIEATTDAMKKNRLLQVLKDYPVSFADTQVSEEINSLAGLYISQGVIPQSKLPDAFHIAIAVVNEMDILLSWNFRHLANVTRETRVNAINIMHNYRNTLRIISPMAVMNYES